MWLIPVSPTEGVWGGIWGAFTLKGHLHPPGIMPVEEKVGYTLGTPQEGF